MSFEISAARPEHTVIGQLFIEFLQSIDHSNTSDVEIHFWLAEAQQLSHPTEHSQALYDQAALRGHVTLGSDCEFAVK